MTTLTELHFADLLPDSIADDATTKALAEVIDIEFSLLLAEVNAPQFLLRIDDMVEPELSILARELCAPFWEPEVKVGRKREVLKKALVWNMFRGSGWCVRDALATVYGAASMQSWHEYGGKRGTFRVTVDSDEPVTADSYGQILRILGETKRQSQHLDAIETPSSNDGDISVTAIAQTGISIGGAMPHTMSSAPTALPVAGAGTAQITVGGRLPVFKNGYGKAAVHDNGVVRMLLPCAGQIPRVAASTIEFTPHTGGIGIMCAPVTATCKEA